MSTGALVVFPTGRGIDWWQARSVASPVPGNWPYGLDHLGSPDHSVRAVEVGAPGRLAKAAMRARRPRTDRPQAEVALGWDESLAERLLAGVRVSRRYCGVIWATDRASEPNAPSQSWLKHSLRQMEALWVLSRPQAPQVTDWLGAGSPPVHYLRFGVDAEFYSPGREPAEPLIVSIGGDRDRDAETLFRVLAEVRRVRPHVRAIAQSTTTLSPPEGVALHKFIPHAEMRSLYRRAAVVLLPTRPNLHGSGMTVALEAAASGRPVVGCDTPGMRDYIIPDRTGMLVAPGDVSAMSEATLALLADPARADTLGQQARQHVEDDYTVEHMCRRLRDLVALGSATPKSSDGTPQVAG